MLRRATTARHTCPSLHCHHTRLLLPAVTMSGVNAPFSVGCHSAASSGESVARSFSPASTVRPAQTGHRQFALVRVETEVCQACPLPHCHQTRFSEPANTCSGVSAPFFVGCHSAASSGYSVARSLKPGSTARLAQKGQPFP